MRILDDYYYVIVRNLSSEKLGGVPISFIYEKTIDSLSIVYHRVAIDMSITDDEKSIQHGVLYKKDKANIVKIAPTEKKH